ncbi:MAG: hypothetical protein H7Y32_16515 [Chloroflexales bacterium]|nr:hypothetical protein [Chloroflexales bacterium]
MLRRCGRRGREGLLGAVLRLLNRAYSDPRYGGATFYGVDAHALQHPELHGKKNNAAHLLRLCWVIERDAHAQSGTVPAWWQRYLARSDVPLLAPPKVRGSITVVDVAGAANPAQYAALMRRWAEDVYADWWAHDDWAQRELERIFAG